MADIPQTSRTLALDEFNPQMPDLLTEIGESRSIDSLDDEIVKRINDKLLCTSFSEFMRKMAPVVYSFFDANSGSVRYTLKKPESLPDNLITEIPLTEQNDVLKMLMTMVDAKRKQGTKNIDFGFETLLELISPKKVLDDIRQVRKELQANYTEYLALPDGDPKREEYGSKLNQLFEDARANYSNTMALLPLAIEDSEQRLLLGAGDDGPAGQKVAAGIAKFEEDGTLRILEAPKVTETALALTDSEANKGLALLLEQDYEDGAGEDTSDYVKALVVRTFSPLATQIGTEVDLQKEVSNHNAYLQLYTDSKAEFIKVVKPLVERILGVREYFEQYTVQSKAGMRPTLLIANATPEMLAKSNNLSRLRIYLNTVNNKNEYNDSVWFAVFPNLSLDKSDDAKVRRAVFEVKDDKQRKDVNSMEVLGQLLGTLYEYQIKTFFSFETGEKSTFDRVAREGVGAFKDRCEPLVNKDFSAYAVPCLPNITVIPKNRSGVVTGKLLETDGEGVRASDAQESIARFWIEGVYIPAAYVAAGITAAWQCPEYLREKFRRNVAPGLPGVRYDIEQGNNALITTTTLAREIAGFTASTKEDINHQNFGFIFASENVKDKKGRSVSHLTVYKARSLAMEGQAFEPIYRTQVTTYFQRVLRQVTGDNKADNITYFFSPNPESQMSVWKGQREFVNAVIQPGDEITFEMESAGRNCDINFNFGGNTRNMQITLNRASAAAS
ncbi:MAG: transcriptional regulator [Oscillospiraceae bacterium]|jgi:hypothetical protein|nr:transcriptional regulator [Oscillospiraceae bacterium]